MAKFVAKQGGKFKNRPAVKASMKIKKKSLKATAAASPLLKKGDARNRLIAKNRTTIVDARDKLAKLAKGTDARQKLEKIRNLKQGKLDVKTTANGGITIVTTARGLQLTTKKKEAASKTGAKVKVGKNVTKNVLPSGKITLSTKAKAAAVDKKKKEAKKPLAPLTRTIAGAKVRPAPKVWLNADDELLNTRVDPILLQRTIRQATRERSRSPLMDYRPRYRERSRSRSPVRIRDYDDDLYRGRSRGRFDYDDPRREAREEELFRQRLREEELLRRQQYESHLTSEAMTYSSPLQGVKVSVTNLQPSVTEDDLNELFGDIGAIKRVKKTSIVSAEVIFVHREDANKAIDVYHNRQLDGLPMKCQIVGASLAPRPSQTSSIKLPTSSRREDRSEVRAAPDISSIHKALFSDRKRPSQGSSLPFASGVDSSSMANVSQKFTVVMPKGKPKSGGGRYHNNRR